MTMCSIGDSAARTRRGWIAVAQRPPPAIAAPAAREPFRQVRRVRPRGRTTAGREVGMDGLLDRRADVDESRARAPLAPWRDEQAMPALVAGPWSGRVSGGRKHCKLVARPSAGQPAEDLAKRSPGSATNDRAAPGWMGPVGRAGRCVAAGVVAG